MMETVFYILAILVLLLHTGIVAYVLWRQYAESKEVYTQKNIETHIPISDEVPIDEFTPDFTKPIKFKIEGRETQEQHIFEEVEDENN